LLAGVLEAEAREALVDEVTLAAAVLAASVADLAMGRLQDPVMNAGS
jgi:hypothetical protein